MPEPITCQRCGLQYRAEDIRKGAVCGCGQKLWRQQRPRWPLARARPGPSSAAGGLRRMVASAITAARRAAGPAAAAARELIRDTRTGAFQGTIPASPGGLARGLLLGEWGAHPVLQAQGDRLAGLVWGLLALLVFRLSGSGGLADSAYSDAAEGRRGVALAALLGLLGAALGAAATRTARRQGLSLLAPTLALVGMAAGLLLTFWAWHPGPLWLLSLILLPPTVSWTGLLIGAAAGRRHGPMPRLAPHVIGVCVAYMALISALVTLPGIPLWSLARQVRAPALRPLCRLLDDLRAGPPSARVWAVLTSQDQDLIRDNLPVILSPHHPEGRRLLLRVLDDPQVPDDARLQVIEALVDTAGPEALEMVARAAYDSRSRSGSRALSGLMQGHKGHPDYALALARSTDQCTAAAGLAMIRYASGEDDAPALVRMAGSDADAWVRAAACAALGRLGQGAATRDAAAVLTRLAQRDPDATVRRTAASAVGQFGNSKSNAALMNIATQDADVRVRDEALMATRGEKTEQRLKLLIEASKSGRWPTDNNAVGELWDFDDVRATRAVLAYLASHPDDSNAICILSYPSEKELPELIKALGSPEPAMRRGALEALSTSKDPRAMAAISAHHDPENDAHWRQELRGLRVGRDRHKYWQELLNVLRLSGPQLRAEALKWMREYHALEGDAQLGPALQDRSLRVRQAAAEVLDNGDPQHARNFAYLLSDKDEGLQLRAVRALVKLKAVDRANPLAATMFMAKSPRVRKACAEALGTLHATSEKSALQQAAREDKDPAVRAAAAQALQKLQ